MLFVSHSLGNFELKYSICYVQDKHKSAGSFDFIAVFSTRFESEKTAVDFARNAPRNTKDTEQININFGFIEKWLWETIKK